MKYNTREFLSHLISIDMDSANYSNIAVIIFTSWSA